MDFSVRPATVADAPGITAAHVGAWQVAYRGIFPDDFLDDMSEDLDDRTARWRVIIVAPDVPETVTLVAEDGSGTIVGWLSWGPNRDDPPPEPAPGSARGASGARIGEIYGIYVHPDHWRTGAGSALMSAGLEQLAEAGYDEATLWVLEDNPRARRFYERHGWREDGALDTFERGGASAVEVRYRLPLKRGPRGR